MMNISKKSIHDFYAITLLLIMSNSTLIASSTAGVKIRVEEEGSGNPVAGIPVYSSASPSMKKIQGTVFEGPAENVVKRWTTGVDGLVTVVVPSADGTVGFVACYGRDADNKSMRDAGYYEAEGVDYKGTEEKLGRWQPWSPTLTIKLKRVIKPIPMYARHVDTKIPAFGKPCGYDLMKSDWVAPFGKGIHADVMFELDKRFEKTVKWESDNYWMRKQNQKASAYLHDFLFTVTFPNAGDGMQSVFVKKTLGRYTGLRLPYAAPKDGYQPRIVQRNYRLSVEDKPHEDNKEHRGRDGDQNYFFRVRTETKYGAVVGALYGKIHDDFEWLTDGTLKFTYYLNPTPNDRNVEFDPKKNLFGEPSCRVGSDRSMVVGDP